MINEEDACTFCFLNIFSCDGIPHKNEAYAEFHMKSVFLRLFLKLTHVLRIWKLITKKVIFQTKPPKVVTFSSCLVYFYKSSSPIPAKALFSWKRLSLELIMELCCRHRLLLEGRRLVIPIKLAVVIVEVDDELELLDDDE